MDIQREPIVSTPDARPFFGVAWQDSETSAEDFIAISQDFDKKCSQILESATVPGFSNVISGLGELSDELVTQGYTEGKIGVSVSRITSEDGLGEVNIISVTYYEEALDDDGEAYDEWMYQSSYRLDESGRVIRSDRIPPSEEEFELSLIGTEESINEINQLSDRHQHELQDLANKLEQSSQLPQTFEQFEEVLLRYRASSEVLRQRQKEEMDALVRAHESQRDEANRSTELMESLGVNDQPITSSEYAKLMKLVQYFFVLP